MMPKRYSLRDRSYPCDDDGEDIALHHELHIEDDGKFLLSLPEKYRALAEHILELLNENPFEAEDDEDNLYCFLKLNVVPHPYGTSSRGTACRYTGGHCIPDEHCAERRKNAGSFKDEYENSR